MVEPAPASHSSPARAHAWLVPGVIAGGAVGGALVGCADGLVALQQLGVGTGRLLLVVTAVFSAGVGGAVAAPWGLVVAAVLRGRRDPDDNPRWWGVGAGAAGSAWLGLAVGPFAGRPFALLGIGVAMAGIALAAAALPTRPRSRILLMAGLIAALGVQVSQSARPTAAGVWPEGGASVLVVTVDGLRASDLDDGAALPTLRDLSIRGTTFSAVIPPSASRDAALAAVQVGSRIWSPGALAAPVSVDRGLARDLMAEGWRTAAFLGEPMPHLTGDFGRVDELTEWLPGLGLSTVGRLLARVRGGDGPRRRADRVVDAVAEALRVRDPRSPPEMLWVHLSDGAFPWEPPPPWDTAFYSSDPSDPAHRGGGEGALPADVQAEWPTVTDLAWVHATRRGALASADAEIARLIDILPAERPWVVAVVGSGGTPPVLLGGPPVSEPVLAADTLAVPLVVYAPGRLPRGARIDAPVELSGLPAALVELAGLTPDPGDGASLVPLAFGRRAPAFARTGLAGQAPWLVGEAGIWVADSDVEAPDASWTEGAAQVRAALASAP